MVKYFGTVLKKEKVVYRLIPFSMALKRNSVHILLWPAFILKAVFEFYGSWSQIRSIMHMSLGLSSECRAPSLDGNPRRTRTALPNYLKVQKYLFEILI